MESVIAPTAVAGASTHLDVEETSQVGGARRFASAMGNAHALDSDAVGRLAIVVTEAATNIVRHGGGGMILLRALQHSGGPVIEVLALDKGPGIPNIDRAMADGYSSSGTAGQGLGAIQRLSDVFAIHSQRGLGTAVLARVGLRRHSAIRPPRDPVLDDRLGAVCVPLRGEVECGDRWELMASQRGITLMLVDGLGHGPEAALAAASATQAFEACADESHDVLFASVDTATRPTRGAAASVIHVNELTGAVTFTGVGNVEGRVFGGPATQYLVPQNGIVGHGMPSLRSTSATLPVKGVVLLHTDGIGSRWRLDAYEGGIANHPALLAGMIYRDFARGRDDASVVVLARGERASH